jgi:hypothetical protein
MSTRKRMMPGQGETRSAEAEVDGATEVYAPRKMTFAENLILTIKVLAGFGLLGAALWGISLWKAAR